VLILFSWFWFLLGYLLLVGFLAGLRLVGEHGALLGHLVIARRLFEFLDVLGRQLRAVNFDRQLVRGQSTPFFYEIFTPGLVFAYWT